MYSLLFLHLSLLPIAISASNTGSVSLWSDSSCEPGDTPDFGEVDPVALNHTLGPDTCFTPRANAHSYIVNSRPTCANGTLALFTFYGNKGCTDDDPMDGTPQSLSADDGYDGVCLALVEFSSLAFICEGVGSGSKGGSGSGGSDVSTVEVMLTTVTSKALHPTATPLKPSEILTYPLYTTSSSSSVYPTATAPSASAPPSTGPSAPVGGSIPFTGEAAGRRMSSFGIPLFFCAVGGLWVWI